MTKTTTIYESMTKNPISLNQTEPLSSAINIINDFHIDHIPIVDKQNHIVGILSKSDLYKEALDISIETTGPTYSTQFLDHKLVADVMTKDPIWISPLEDIHEAIDILLDSRFHSLPVCEEEYLVGIITARDLLKVLHKSRSREVEQ